MAAINLIKILQSLISVRILLETLPTKGKISININNNNYNSNNNNNNDNSNNNNDNENNKDLKSNN